MPVHCYCIINVGAALRSPRSLGIAVLIALSVAALALSGGEPARAQESGDPPPGEQQNAGEQREGYEDRLAKRIARYQDARRGGSDLISGLALTIPQGGSDEFTVGADGLDADFEYRYSFLLTTGGSGGIGFNASCTFGSEAVSVPQGNTEWSTTLTLYACREGNYTLTVRLFEYSIGEDEEYLLEEDEKRVRVTPPPTPTAEPPPDVPPVLPSVSDRTYEVGDDVNLLLPRASGGNPPLAYSVSGLPSTLRFSPSTRRITGRPAQTGVHTVTYEVSDDDGDTDSETFTITIEEEDTEPSLPSITDKTYEVGENVNLLLPAASGGNPPLTYSVSGLPSTLRFSSSTRRITGTPSQADEYTVTYRVRDDDRDTDSETFTLTIEPAPPPPTPDPPELDAPPAPDGVSASTINQDNILLSWDLREGVAREQVRFRIKDSGPWPEPVAAETIIFASRDARGTGRYTSRIAGLDPDTTYEFEVQSYGDGARWQAAWGPWSGTEEATTFPAPTLALAVPDGGLEADGSTDITVNAGELASTLAYRLSIAAGTHTGFDDECSSGVRSVDLPVLADRTSYAWPLTLHGCSVGTDTLTARLYEVHEENDETERATAEEAVGVSCPAPDFGGASVTDKSWQQNSPIVPFTLPEATGGCGDLTYTLSPPLPSGVTRSATHQVSGTPTVAMARTEYTWTAVNTEGDTDSLTFYIAVPPDNVPTFGNQSVPDQSWRQNVAVEPFTLPRASGGDGTLTYELDPDLPAGVTWNSRTHRVSGTPTGTMDETGYTWTAEDEDGDTATLTFDITVALVPLPPPPDGVGATTVNQDNILLSWDLREGVTREQVRFRIKDSGPWPEPVAAETIIFASRGPRSMNRYESLVRGLDPDTTYEFEVQSFGDGVRWQAAWGPWSGTEEATTFPAPTLALAVPDGGLEADGSTDITVNAGELAPTLAYRLSIATGTHTGFDDECSAPVRSVDLPALADRTSYAWPLTLHGCSVGTDTLTARLYEVHEENDETERATARETVRVTCPTPDFGGESVMDKSWQQDSPIVPFTLPEATGGCGDLTYTLSPPLPSGVTRSATHRVSGTPTAAMARTEYTWTAANTEGDTDSLTFYVTVPPDNVPTFGNQSVPDQSWKQNVAITPFNLPRASGGDGTLTHTLSPDLPSGVTLNANTRQVSGTPTGTMDETGYTWTAEDEDGDTATLTFDITVALVPLPPAPDGVSASTINQDNILLSWDLREGIAREKVRYQVKDSDSWTEVDASTIIFASRTTRSMHRYESLVRGLDPDTAYEFEVQSYGDGVRWQAAWGPWSGTVEDTTFPAPTLSIAVPDGGLEADGSTDITVNAGDLAPTLAYRLSIGAGVHTGFDAECAAPARSVDLPVQADRTSYAWPLTLHGCTVGADTLTARLYEAHGDGEGETERATAEAEVGVACPAPDFGGESVEDQSWTQDESITPFTLPEVRDACGNLTYTLTPELPLGVTRDADTHQILGTPTDAMARTEYTWTTADEAGETDALTFFITVQLRAPEDLVIIPLPERKAELSWGAVGGAFGYGIQVRERYKKDGEVVHGTWRYLGEVIGVTKFPISLDAIWDHDGESHGMADLPENGAYQYAVRAKSRLGNEVASPFGKPVDLRDIRWSLMAWFQAEARKFDGRPLTNPTSSTNSSGAGFRAASATWFQSCQALDCFSVTPGTRVGTAGVLLQSARVDGLRQSPSRATTCPIRRWS